MRLTPGLIMLCLGVLRPISYLERLTDDEKVIGECLRAAVEGPFFPEWEFQTLLGLSRAEVAAELATWPATGSPEDQDLAVNNALNNHLTYPHRQWAEWPKYISVSEDEVDAVFARWRAANK
ncbi:hypothetical protein JGU66_14075 [Myxococcaceae bacterium JPH2]|nr:hypothetical protein [Myxococcaceae bacterium JPH2]